MNWFQKITVCRDTTLRAQRWDLSRGTFASTASRFRALALTALSAAVIFLQLSNSRADVTLTSTFGGIDAIVSIADGPNDPNPIIDDDSQEPISFDGSYNAAANAHATVDGVDGVASGNLQAAVTVTGDQLFFTSSGSSLSTWSCSDSGSPFCNFFSLGSYHATTEISFTITESSSYTLSGMLSCENGGSISVVTFGGNTNVPDFILGSEVDGGPQTLPVSISGTLAPGTYSIEFDMRTSSSKDRPPSSASGNMSFTLEPPCEVSRHVGANGQEVVTVGQCGVIEWDNAAGGSFATKENWVPQTVPGANDTAVFALDKTYSVDVGTATTDRLQILDGNVTFTNANYMVNAVGPVPPSILVDDATLILASGSLLGMQAVIGESLGGTAIVLSGATLSLTTLGIGGMVEVHDGGLLDVQGKLSLGATLNESGHLTIGDFPPFGDGGGVAQTLDCTVFDGSLGVHGQGTTGARLDVTDLLSVGGLLDDVTPPTSATSALITGGAVVVAQRFALGDREGISNALVTISGVGGNGQPTLLNVAGASPSLLVSGAPGQTLLEVKDGGMLSTSANSATSRIGSGLLVGEVMVQGKNGSQPSSWSMADEFLDIGSQAVPSELLVQDGGMVTGDTFVTLGRSARDQGRLTIAGADSAVTAGEVVVGEGGDGVLTLTDGAHCNVALGRVGAPTNPDNTRGTGLATIQGTLLASSEWHATNAVTIGDTEPGTLRLEGETIGPFSVGGATLRADGTVTVGAKGFVRGNGTLVAKMLENHGSIGPDVDVETAVRGKAVLAGAPVSSSGGIIVTDGDYEQPADGKLTIDTTGVGEGEFDVLHVTGNATLGGTLEMLFPGAYLPKAGDSFQFLQVDGTISGDFAEVTFPQLLPGFQFDTMQVAGGLLFTAINDAVLAPTFLLNISTRLQVGTEENVLIGGFILQGTEPKRVLIRAVGPSLAAVGLSGALADPTLELHDGTGALIGQNDDWRETQTGGLITEDQFFEIFATGIPPTSFEESAIIATLEPGAYTAIIAGADSSTGIGLVEVYDLGPAAAPAKLANISTRGFVQTGDDVMIGGFIVGNQTSQVLVRAIGPSLAAFGVSGALADPTLDLHDVNGALLASNDNWRSDQEAEIEATAIPPNDDKESAILQTLAPGAYTAILRGVSDTTGVGLVEAYNVD
jgi:T5SS/PEP-CTERM-associated repeat protein